MEDRVPRSSAVLGWGDDGSDVNLRVVLEPLFIKYGVNVVFSGHDHIYERITPQKGIYYFVSGSAGELRSGDLRRSEMTAAGLTRQLHACGYCRYHDGVSGGQPGRKGCRCRVAPAPDTPRRREQRRPAS